METWDKLWRMLRESNPFRVMENVLVHHSFAFLTDDYATCWLVRVRKSWLIYKRTRLFSPFAKNQLESRTGSSSDSSFISLEIQFIKKSLILLFMLGIHIWHFVPVHRSEGSETVTGFSSSQAERESWKIIDKEFLQSYFLLHFLLFGKVPLGGWQRQGR